jgi:hypothetical protein
MGSSNQDDLVQTKPVEEAEHIVAHQLERVRSRARAADMQTALSSRMRSKRMDRAGMLSWSRIHCGLTGYYVVTCCAAARCADSSCPALSSAAAASSRIG